MKLTSSYAAEINYNSRLMSAFKQTVKIYNDAISYCVSAFVENWFEIQLFDKYRQVQYAESLIHSTKTNKAVYTEFDSKFHKLPAYLRRSVIQQSLGHLSAYYSAYNNWVATQVGKQPSLQVNLHKLPTFYKTLMYLDDCTGSCVRLKLFYNNDWRWFKVHLKATDVKSIAKHAQNAKMSCPTLEKKNKKFYLRFTFEEQVVLNETKLVDQKILAVDFGINTDAVCSVMNVDGAILAREFINFPSDKDHLFHTLNKIKGVQQKYNGYNTQKLWRYVKFCNEELARKVACSVTNLAVKHDVDVIVMEHLDLKGKRGSSRKQRLSLWKVKSIQHKVELKAHRHGIRVSTVNARGTSRLAFDGSGAIERGTQAGFVSNKMCRFPSGKVYNCDLSASYNIGARYFIRELKKSIPAMVWSELVAKVPEAQIRAKCTLSTLLAFGNAG